MADDHGSGTYITTNAADRLQRDAAEQLAYWRSVIIEGVYIKVTASNTLTNFDYN